MTKVSISALNELVVIFKACIEKKQPIFFPEGDILAKELEKASILKIAKSAVNNPEKPCYKLTVKGKKLIELIPENYNFKAGLIYKLRNMPGCLAHINRVMQPEDDDYGSSSAYIFGTLFAPGKSPKQICWDKYGYNNFVTYVPGDRDLIYDITFDMGK